MSFLCPLCSGAPRVKSSIACCGNSSSLDSPGGGHSINVGGGGVSTLPSPKVLLLCLSFESACPSSPSGSGFGRRGRLREDGVGSSANGAAVGLLARVFLRGMLLFPFNFRDVCSPPFRDVSSIVTRRGTSPAFRCAASILGLRGASSPLTLRGVSPPLPYSLLCAFLAFAGSWSGGARLVVAVVVVVVALSCFSLSPSEAEPPRSRNAFSPRDARLFVRRIPLKNPFFFFVVAFSSSILASERDTRSPAKLSRTRSTHGAQRVMAPNGSAVFPISHSVANFWSALKKDIKINEVPSQIARRLAGVCQLLVARVSASYGDQKAAPPNLSNIPNVMLA